MSAAVERVDAVVIGAGVVGLACARALAARGLDTLIVERHAAIGTETSARNSEVIHAGLYYPTGSQKAALCVRGNALLYDYCTVRGIAHRRCGKLIVATEAAQLPGLAALQAQGEANGVPGLRALGAAEAMALEPALRCVAALHSTSTGIVDSHGLMLSLLGDAERAGALLALNTAITGGVVGTAENAGAAGIVLDTSAGLRLAARLVVNSAGLAAPALAASLTGFPSDRVPRAGFAKGSYFALAGRAPFSRLVYPLPVPGGLGVHLTLDLAGQARFGPDVEWIAAPDYAVDPRRADGFYAEVRRYWPGLPDGALLPAYAGVRPKIAGPEAPAADFLIQGPAAHGVPGLVNLFGIESPGLTAALAIAERVAAQAESMAPWVRV